MPAIKCQLIQPAVTGNPAEASSNTLSFFSASQAAAITDIVPVVKGLTNSLVGMWSNLVSGNGHIIKLTDLDDPQPRYPFYEEVWNMSSAPSTASLPPEVAICMSFQGDRVSGTPQARRRGRIYVGPLRSSTLGTDGRPSAGTMASMDALASAFLTAALGMASTDWGIWSETGSIFTPVTNGWIDNEYDTQRRRGRVATSRSLFP